MFKKIGKDLILKSVRVNTNNGGADFVEVFTITVTDDVAPTGYSVNFTTNPVNSSNKTAISFRFAGAEVEGLVK